MTDQENNLLAHPSRRQALGMLMLGASGVILSGVPGGVRGALAAEKSVKGQLTVGFSQEPTVFNPHLPHIEVDEGVHFAVFDPLFAVDPVGNFIPLLAAEVPTVKNGGISADGLHWKVKLRDGVKWHDGKPFTADDVKATLELLVDANFRSWRKTGHDLVRDLTVVSPTEITWRMEKPFAPYSAILASTFITPKHLLSAAGDPNNAPFNNAPVGTGAFKWVERVPGDHILLAANPDYFGDGPYVEKLIYKYIPNLNVMYTQFKTGDIDVLGLQWITPDHYDEAKKLDGKIVEGFPGSTVESFSFNMERPQFKDPAVRQALYHAIDKGSIIDALYYGLPMPTESYVPQQSYYYNPDLPKHSYDMKAAKKLLDDAGWVAGADGIRAKNGVKLSFSCSTTAGNHLREQVQQYLQQSFKELGVEMTIANLPPAVMWGDYWMLSKFDSVIVGLDFLTGADPDTSDFFRSTSSGAKGGNGQNNWQYVSKEVDDLLTRGGELFVPEERKAVYLKIQETVRNDLPFLPMFQYVKISGRKKGVENVLANINTRIDTWNVASWRWA